MKFLGLALVAATFSVGAFATTIVSTCGTFSSNTDAASGTWNCASFGSLDGGGTVTSAYLIYLSDFSSPETSSVTENTTFTFTGTGLTLLNTSDTVTTSCTTSPCSSGSNTYGSFDDATFQNFSSGPPVTLAGFTDPISSLSNSTQINIGYNQTMPTGTTLTTSGYAELVINYTPATTPEPGSMMLLGSGLLAAGLIGRKKLASRK